MTANLSLHRILRNRLALSTVVTTLIILVISVLLASVVTYFAINVVSTRVQEESLALTKQHLYHNSTASPASASYAQGTLMVINTGGRDIVIDKLAVRGQECSWHDLTTKKVVLFCVTTDSVSSDMPYVYNFNLTTTDPAQNKVRFGSTDYQFTVATNDLVLRSGFTMMIYIVNPDSITINDIGLTCSITLYTAQAMYYRESNVQAVEEGSSSGVTQQTQATPTPSPSPTPEPTLDPANIGSGDNGEGVDVPQAQVWFNGGTNQAEFALVIVNGGESSVTVSSFWVGGSQPMFVYAGIGTFTVSDYLVYETSFTNVQGHTLTLNNQPAIPAGQTAIIYGYLNTGAIHQSDVGQQVSMVINLVGTSSITVNMNVQDVPT